MGPGFQDSFQNIETSAGFEGNEQPLKLEAQAFYINMS
jgi:hypothetical protein